MMSKAEIDKMESNRSEKKRSKKTIQTNRTSDICNSAKKRRTKSNIQAQMCSMHKLPLSYLCDMDIICEKCSLEPPYVDRKAINLRTTSFQLLKSVEQNLTEFKNILESVEECRTVELRQNILSQIHTYFDSVEECLDIIKEEKINEVHKIFGILKFEDLDDLKLHYNLRNSAESALESISEDFKNKAFNLIYLNKNSYENIR